MAEGATEPIDIAAGNWQGCPLSGLLFNMALDPLVRAVQGGGQRHAVLAYADDLTALADDPAMLQEKIDLITTLARQLGLVMNPAKCRTLHLSGKTPVGTRPATFAIQGTPIPRIEDFCSHQFLGRPVSFRVLPPDAPMHKPSTSVGGC